MKSLVRILAAAVFAVGGIAAQAGAETIASQSFAELSTAKLTALVEDETQGWVQQPCEIGIPGFSELLRRVPEKVWYERGLLISQSFCASHQDNLPEAIARFDEFESRFGETEMDQYRIALAFNAEQPGDALDRFAKMARRGDGEAFSGIEVDYFFAVVRELDRRGLRDELADFSATIYGVPLFAELPADMQGSIAYRALIPVIAVGDSDKILQVLQDIRHPTSYPDFLASREYEAAWPLIEQHVGKGLSKVTQSYREWALARLATDKYDRDRFSDAAHSLLYDGKFEEAVALVKKWRDRPGSFDHIAEGDGWAVNIEAYALDGLGRFDEADALFDRLSTIDADENPWVVNFVINRSSRLVGHGKWQAGLAAAALARDVAGNHGSLYAKMLIARDFTCAYANTGKLSEAVDELGYLVENQDEHPWITVQGLQCVGREDEAIDLLVASLADEIKRSRMLNALQDERFDLFYTPSILPKPYNLVESSPRVRAEFDKYARVIPLEFAPVASIRRQSALKSRR